MTNVLTGEGALGVLRLVVFEKGNGYVYPRAEDEVDTCRNFKDGQPSCIVGHVFARLGVTYELAVAAAMNGSMGAYSSIRNLGSYGWTDWTFSPEAQNALTSAQSWQDRGSTWGEALAAAEESLKSGHSVLHPLDGS